MNHPTAEPLASEPGSDADFMAHWWVWWIDHARDSGRGSLAVTEAQTVLSALASMPDEPARRTLRASLSLEIARVQGSDPGFTLRDAERSLATCKSLLSADALLALRSRFAMVLAEISYDLGELRAIEASMADLSELVRALSAQKEPAAAARRMLDLARLHLRVGDPVQAAYMVQESRAIFDAGKVIAPEAQAVADHLLGMLPLHAAARAGMASQAVASARERCLSAAEYFEGEHCPREALRVRETLGRLESLVGKRDHAEKTLKTVISGQELLGDLTGLSRSLSALSELFSDEGRALESLDALSASLGCNRQKSSTLGVALNRRAFNTLTLKGLPPDAEARALALSEKLSEAESSVGSAAVPTAPFLANSTDRPPGE